MSFVFTMLNEPNECTDSEKENQKQALYNDRPSEGARTWACKTRLLLIP